MEPKTDCFAYSDKNGRSDCLALTKLSCKDCRFFKTKEQRAQELLKERRN